MVKKTYKLPNGQEASGQEVEFEAEKESFNVYILHDGTKLKVKYVLSQVVRLDAYLPDGTPIYMLNGGQVLATDVPENLKKRSE